MFVLLVIWVFSFLLFLFTPQIRDRDIRSTHAGTEVKTSFATAEKAQTVPHHLSFLFVGAAFRGFWELSKLTQGSQVVCPKYEGASQNSLI